MDLMQLVETIRQGRWIEMRDWLVCTFPHAAELTTCPEPAVSLPHDDRVLAAGLAELLAARWHVPAPAWAASIGPISDEVWLAPLYLR